jgi:electron transfer flavoprotein beta subunit
VKILVTVKRVTDPDTKVRLKPDGTGIITEGVEFKANPFDEIAVEEALRIIEKQKGEVVVASIGPPEATKEIRTALAMGATRGILVESRDEDLDSLLVARILQKLVEKEKPDLIILGKQAVDGDSNQVGQILAQVLGLPQACFASKVEIDGTRAKVTREVDGGSETLSVSLPAVVTADLRLNEPRYASLPGIMKAKKKPIESLTLAALGLAGQGPKVRVVGYEAPPTRKGGRKVASVEELVALLKNEAKVL